MTVTGVYKLEAYMFWARESRVHRGEVISEVFVH